MKPYPHSVSHEIRCRVLSELGLAFLKVQEEAGGLIPMPFAGSFARATCAIAQGTWAELDALFISMVLHKFPKDHEIWIFITKG